MTRHIRDPILAPWLWLVAGCAAAWAEPVAPTLAQLNDIGLAIAQQKCPRPVEVKTSFVANPRDRDVADEMQSFDCRTYRVAVYRSLSQTPPREVPLSVVLDGEHPLAQGPWSVGASAATIHSLLGPPTKTFGEVLVYALDPKRPDRDTLTFEVADGIVQAVTWTWEVE